MLRRTVYSAMGVAVAAAMTALAMGSAAASEPPPGANAGPPYKFTTELMGGHEDLALKDQAMLTRTQLGYRIWSGSQNSHLVVTLVDGRLSFVDTGTQSFKKLASACERQKVKVGISALCRVPGTITVSQPLLIEVWPRLGNDYTDTSSLPDTFAVTVLGDEGHDVAHFGAGPDFFNGAAGRDIVWGGGGNDWIRGGIGNDAAFGGDGDDDIVGQDGSDTMRGGDGNDRLWGGNDSDHLWGDTGADFDVCGNGTDTADADSSDRVLANCESVNHVARTLGQRHSAAELVG